MDITFAKYIKENYPNLLNEYKRYLRKDIPLKIGSKVKTLRPGFGGNSGMIRIVKCYFNNEQQRNFTKVGEYQCDMIIINGGGYDYCLDMETWWKDVEIISE